MTVAACVDAPSVPEHATELRVPYDIRLGVTGHRKIEEKDHAAVGEAVRRLHERLSQILGRSPLVPLRWTVVSPIARGADQIVAEAMVGQSGVTLEVLLPFKVEEYRKDFKTDRDLARFEALFSDAAARGQVHRLSGPFGEDRDGDPDASRNLAYLRLGQQVVETSEMVIAIWRGCPPDGPGGTADVVEYALAQKRHVLWIDPDNPAREARVIRSVRYTSRTTIDVDSVELQAAAAQISQGYSQQLAYCLDSSVRDEDIQKDVEKRRLKLTGIAVDAGLATADIAPVSALLPHCTRADLLAQFYQRLHLRATIAVMVLAAVAVSIAVAQTLFFPKKVELIALELIGMIAALGLWWYSRRCSWHMKWLHDRYLAERIRLTMYVALVDRPPGVVLDGGLPFYPGPQYWLRVMADELACIAHALKPSANAAALKNFLLRAWFEDQRRFHLRNSMRMRCLAHRFHRIGQALFAVTFLMAALHFLNFGHHEPEGPPGVDRLDLWISFFAVVLPVWAGGIHAVTAQLELDRVAERSRRMTGELHATITNMRSAETPSDLRRIVREAASLMVKESHEWWVLLSFQDVRLHV